MGKAFLNGILSFYMLLDRQTGDYHTGCVTMTKKQIYLLTTHTYYLIVTNTIFIMLYFNQVNFDI